ncbi:uncharacterized protein BX664DRAFT_341918 [Halteromyces radiatus]|uniref:uncharacterized protein n=1 Tax=Halteromyces radiatus TaxID=101107 RepID=UPI00222095E3|nr:uncharacterized protein BX664DRAFT_341918 [Halteromyces radiatus]KAI8079968.1 hypothetical protein BX664DRAFT_341918 [Halteromyces radiatus]
MINRTYSLFCFVFFCILVSVIEGSTQIKKGKCFWPENNDLLDIQGMPITANATYMFKALKHGLVLGPRGRFGEARMVLMDRVNSTSSITVIPQIIKGEWGIQLAGANPPLYLEDVPTNILKRTEGTLMFDTRKTSLYSFLPNKGANNFNIGHQGELASARGTNYVCRKYLMATSKHCKQCEIDRQNPETTYFTLTKIGN